MSLAACSTHSFSTRTQALGTVFFRLGRIKILRMGHREASLSLASGDEVCQVELDWSESFVNILYAGCSCGARGTLFPCPHVWAAMLALDASGHTGHWPLTGNALKRGSQSAADCLPNTKPAAASRRTPAAKPADESSLWRFQLPSAESAAGPHPSAMPGHGRPATVRYSEPWYVLNVSNSRQTGKLVLDLYHRELRKSGQLGRPKRLKIRRGTLPAGCDPEDRRILQLLLGNEAEADGHYRARFHDRYAYDFSSLAHFAIAPAMYEVLLPRLSDTGRLFWQLDDELDPAESRPVRWDPGPPWRFRVQLTTDSKAGCWRLQGQLEREQETVALAEPVLLLARGLVLFPDRIGRLDAEADFPWISCLREHGTVRVPFEDRDLLLKRLFDTPAAPRVDLPDDFQLVVREVPPQGRLMLRPPGGRASRRQLYADVGYRYGEHAVGIGEARRAIVDPQGRQVVFRDQAGERRLLDRLDELGVQATEGREQHFGQFAFAAASLREIVDSLTAEGWVVESEGRRIRRPGRMQMNVTSGIDWFELDGEIDFDGVAASLPQLLTAAREQQEYVRLDDGTCGMLPEEWLGRFAGLAALGTKDDETLKFSSCQALLLDALLASQAEVQVDDAFDQLRNRLQDFHGVRPARQPRGFSGKLREYQREGLGWLHFLRDFKFGGCLADDMGLGKTVQVLALLQSRRLGRIPKGQSRRPSLAVVPKSLVFNWLSEAERFTPRLRVMDYTGIERAERLEEIDQFDLLVTTYGVLRRDILKLKEIRFDYAILDESQAIKNAGSLVSKASRLLQADHRLAMTGTPVENHLGELWSLFEFLNPGMLGRSSRFQSLMRGGADGDQGALQLLAGAVRPFLLRRTKQQVLTELPEKTEQTLFCEMLPRQRQMYDELRDYYRASLTQKVDQEGLERAKIHVLEALLRLRQAACHPGLVDPERCREPSAKLRLLLEQLEEVTDEGHKTLIFSQFTSLLAIVRQELDQRKFNYAYLDGRTRKRKQAVQRFQEDPDCRLFLISLKAGGHGLNLTAADYVYILDPWWNPAVEAQAIDRAHRIGQQQRVFAYRLICRDTVEDKILELQQEKRSLAEAIMTEDNSLIRNLTAEDLQRLLS